MWITLGQKQLRAFSERGLKRKVSNSSEKNPDKHGNVPRRVRGTVWKVEKDEGTNLEMFVRKGVPIYKRLLLKRREKKRSSYAEERRQEKTSLTSG